MKDKFSIYIFFYVLLSLLLSYQYLKHFKKEAPTEASSSRPDNFLPSGFLPKSHFPEHALQKYKFNDDDHVYFLSLRI